MNTGAQEEAHGIANITINMIVEYQVCQSKAENEATIRSITDTDSIVCQLDGEIHCIASNEQM